MIPKDKNSLLSSAGKFLYANSKKHQSHRRTYTKSAHF